MTIGTAKEIIAQLKAEKLESNKELIKFYERKIREVIISAVNKAFDDEGR